MKSNINLTHGVTYAKIPTRSQYDKYLNAALKAPKGEAVEVPVSTTAASLVSALNQLIVRRGAAVRVIRRGSQVYVARRESK